MSGLPPSRHVHPLLLWDASAKSELLMEHEAMQHTVPDVIDVKSFVGAEDFDAWRDFYVALGWKVVYDSDTLRVMQLKDHRFYLQNYHVKLWCENTMLHISVSDVDEWYRFVQSRFESHDFGGASRLSEPPRDEGYARVFYVWDPSGVLLHFAQLKSH